MKLRGIAFEMNKNHIVRFALYQDKMKYHLLKFMLENEGYEVPKEKKIKILK